MGGLMTTEGPSAAERAAQGREQKAAARALWALGDYHRFATRTVWELGPELVTACGIASGQRVLDVASGSGNVALRAAAAGACVVASDLTPENFNAGRAEARTLGVELEWAEADAEALPFRDGEFDVVTSCLGAIFAPDHQAVAEELVRVCRPGGTVGMINFTPEGLAGEFFAAVARHAPPPPPGARPPLDWGSESYLRELFGNRLGSLEMTRKDYVERSDSPESYVGLFRETFGPVIGLRGLLADDPDRLAAFDDDFDEFAQRSNTGRAGGAAEYRYEYLLVIARTAQ
ncbi:MAG: methyltransferase domain-containing protein [Actinobacteria bacterium]|nr:methyltransferase domain-containing protein [Actinomycetota bacterium]